MTLVIILSGCKNKNSFLVDGTIKGRKEKYIYINRLDVNTPVFLDSARIGRNGHFRFKIRAAEPDFYQMGFSKAEFITLLAEPGEKITLELNGENFFENYRISGSAGSEKLLLLDRNLAKTKK